MFLKVEFDERRYARQCPLPDFSPRRVTCARTRTAGWRRRCIGRSCRPVGARHFRVSFFLANLLKRKNDRFRGQAEVRLRESRSGTCASACRWWCACSTARNIFRPTHPAAGRRRGAQAAVPASLGHRSPHHDAALAQDGGNARRAAVELAVEFRPVEGDVGDRELPHGGSRRPCHALRGLLAHADRL